MDMLHKLVPKKSSDHCPEFHVSELLIDAQETYVDSTQAIQRLRHSQAILTEVYLWRKKVFSDHCTRIEIYTKSINSSVAELITILEDRNALLHESANRLRPNSIFLDCFGTLYLRLNQLQNNIQDLSKSSLHVAREKVDIVESHLKMIESSTSELLRVLAAIPNSPNVHLSADQSISHDSLVLGRDVNESHEITESKATDFHAMPPASLVDRHTDVSTVNTFQRSDFQAPAISSSCENRDLKAGIATPPRRNISDGSRHRFSLQNRLRAGRHESAFSYKSSTPPCSPGLSGQESEPVVTRSRSSHLAGLSPRLASFKGVTNGVEGSAVPMMRAEYDQLSLRKSSQKAGRERARSTLEDWEQAGLQRRATLKVSKPAPASRPSSGTCATQSPPLIGVTRPALSLEQRRFQTLPRSKTMKLLDSIKTDFQGLQHSSLKSASLSGSKTSELISPSLRSPSLTPYSSTISQTTYSGSSPHTPFSLELADLVKLPADVQAISSTDSECIARPTDNHMLLHKTVSSLKLDTSRTYTATELAQALPNSILSYDGHQWIIALESEKETNLMK